VGSQFTGGGIKGCELNCVRRNVCQTVVSASCVLKCASACVWKIMKIIRTAEMLIEMSSQMILCAMLLCCIAHSIICTRLFRGKMHSGWFNGIEVLQGRWQHGEKVGYCYPSGLEKDSL